MTDFNEPAPKPASEQRVCPKLDPYKPTIDKWLKEDKQSPRKQRHTAKRVFKRLKKEIVGFNCSYRTVASYYAVKHRELFQQCEKWFSTIGTVFQSNCSLLAIWEIFSPFT